MTPALADSLRTAKTCLIDAAMLSPVPRAAAREAYLAAYHAAEAYVFHCTGKIAKTHSGLRSEFNRLAKGEPRIGRDLVKFLSTAYELKSIADYNASLKIVAKNPWSLYGRGIDEMHKQKSVEGQSDLDQATAIWPQVADEFKRWGIIP